MDGLKRLHKRTCVAVPKTMISLMGLMVGLLSVMGLISYLGSAKFHLEETEFHTLPVVPGISSEPPERLAIEDRSPYAQDESLSLRQYISYLYDDGALTEEAEYDGQGVRTLLHTLEYDTAGNICREQVQRGADGTQTRRHIYEYNDSGRVVHEEIYWDDALVKNNYFRYTDEGCAGVSYSYLNEQIDGGISQYCADHTEFLEDAEGNMLCAFKMKSLLLDRPNEAWKMQWREQEGRLVNRVEYYGDNVWQENTEWYRYVPRADKEQFNLYEPEKKLALQLNYEWQQKSQAFSLQPSFYRARYDGNCLLWQMDYVESGIIYFSVCRYDTEGRLREAVEYSAEGEKPEAMFYRYEYPEEDREEQYSYAILGCEFSHVFGDGDNIRLTFSGEGVLSGIEMTEASENGPEKYEFCEAGENAGKLLRMQAGADTVEGENAFLEKLEEEAAAYGFRAGEDLTDIGSGAEGGAE